jgi:hypothetical protein
MCLFLFVFGVFTFSFSIGSLSSVLSGMDTRDTNLKEKLKLLDNLKKDYLIPFDLYNKINRTLKYDHSMYLYLWH